MHQVWSGSSPYDIFPEENHGGMITYADRRNVRDPFQQCNRITAFAESKELRDSDEKSWELSENRFEWHLNTEPPPQDRKENALESFQRKVRQLAVHMRVTQKEAQQALIRCKHDRNQARLLLEDLKIHNRNEPMTSTWCAPRTPSLHHKRLIDRSRDPFIPSYNFESFSPPTGTTRVRFSHNYHNGPRPYYPQTNKSPYAMIRDAFGPEYNRFYSCFSKYKDKMTTAGVGQTGIFVGGRARFKKERRDLGGFAEYAREILAGVEARRKINPKTFLDLGAAPGGMATALFETFPNGLRGWGVSLPATEGGFPIAFVNSHYNVIYKDCTLRPPLAVDPLKDVPLVDLVICDTTVMGYDKKTNFKADIYILKQKLLSRSLGAGLRKLKIGGALLIRLQMQPSLFSLRVHSFLFDHFEGFASVKPLKLFHMSREYYLLCTGFKGFCQGKENTRNDPTDRLITWACRDGNDDPQEINWLLQTYTPTLLSLLRHCWRASKDCLTERLERMK